MSKMKLFSEGKIIPNNIIGRDISTSPVKSNEP
jgi:hypothetical protein